MTELRIPCFRSRIPGTRHCSTQTVKTAGTQQKSNSAEFLSDGSLKTQRPPLAPVKQGRGAGGEGAIPPVTCPRFRAHSGSVGGRGSCRAPRVLSRAAAQQELRPPVMAHKSGFSSKQAACDAPAPSRSRLVVDPVVRGDAWPGGPRGKQGGLHPSPPTPLPFQGRGVSGAISTAA